MKKNPSVDDNPPHVLILNCTLTVNDLHLGGGRLGGSAGKSSGFEHGNLWLWWGGTRSINHSGGF